MRLALIPSESQRLPPQARAGAFLWRRLWLLEAEERMIEEAVFKVSSQAVFKLTLLFPPRFLPAHLALVQKETAGLQPSSLISASHTSFFHCSTSPRFILLLQERKVTFFQPFKLGLFLSRPLTVNDSKWEEEKKKRKKEKKKAPPEAPEAAFISRLR